METENEKWEQRLFLWANQLIEEISWRISDNVDGGDASENEDNEPENVPVEEGNKRKRPDTANAKRQVPCIYCGKKYTGERGVRVHMKHCSEK